MSASDHPVVAGRVADDRSSSPAPPATSAAGWCRGCWRPATACAAWSATPRACRAAPGCRTSRSSPGDVLRPGQPRARLWPASTSPTTSSTAWPRAAASTSATSRPRGASAPPRPRPASAASSTSAAWATPAPTSPTHLRSRQETGDALREAGVPVTEFRAAVIVGSGSLSFEMIRYLTERLPVMICPRWVYTRVQPIAVRDVLRLPGGGAATARERRPRDRDRRRRRAHLRRHDARLRRRSAGCSAGCCRCRCSRRGCRRTGCTSSRPIPVGHRAPAHRGPAQRGGRARRHGPRGCSRRSARWTTCTAVRARRGDAGERRGRDVLGGRARHQPGRRAARGAHAARTA